MYKLVDIQQIIENRTYFSHTDLDKVEELLSDHMQLTLKYYEHYCNVKGIGEKVINLLTKIGFTEEEINIGYSLFVNAIYLHDIGKINPAFQYKKMGNSLFKKNDFYTEQHSIFSSYIYICECLKQLPLHTKRLNYLLYCFAYIISRHHGCLGDIVDFDDELKKYDISEFYSAELEEWIDSERLDCRIGSIINMIADKEAFYILNRLLFACITSCDFAATGEYMSDTTYTMECISDFQSFSTKYYESILYSTIHSYQRKNILDICNINELRTELFLEAQEGLMKNPRANIYYLEAPTGSGKTNCSINLGLKIIENDCTINNMFYIFPFNTLVEQTADTLYKYFSDEDVVIINSVNPIDINVGSQEQPNYEALLINRLNNNYPIVITTHVNFFNMLFGTRREHTFPLLKLCNSVVIIDEIQSYKNDIWPEMIAFLSKYSSLLNIKIIIMSATLPKVDQTFNFDGDFHALLSDSKKFFGHPLFKDRVKIDTSLM